MSYPEVKIVQIAEIPSLPHIDTMVEDVSNDPKKLEEILTFYQDTLIPQLVCNQDGTYPAIPHGGWILNEHPKRTVITARHNGELYGAWMVKDGQILYPVANNEYIALVYRLLWDETTKHFDYVWAYTDNPVIRGFINAARRTIALPTSPQVNGDKLEWRR